MAHRQNNFRDSKMADGAIAVVIPVDRLQYSVRESVVRYRNAVQRADNILRRRPVMVVESLGAGHATKREQQHPSDYLSQSCAHCGGKSTFFFGCEFVVLFFPKIATSWDIATLGKGDKFDVYENLCGIFFQKKIVSHTI